MNLALREAEKSRGLCSPNPFVGAIIVADAQIVATGRTQAYGKDHAEIDALKNAGNKAKGATLYVSLEPCCHFGKTPPCTQAIIKAGIKKVVAGICDPNPLVAGKGFQELRSAGIEVITGVCASKIAVQNEAFICYIQKQRPFVTWKTALSLDGKYAAEDGSSRWITNEQSRRLVHQTRAGTDAVLSGIRTVLQDDAMLNARGVRMHKQALRVVLDPFLELDAKTRFAQSAMDFPSLIFHHSTDQKRVAKLAALGIELIYVQAEGEELDLKEVLQVLYQRKISSILLETGNQLSQSFWQAKLVDKCMIFYGNIVLGGSRSLLGGLNLPSIHDAIALKDIRVWRLGDNALITGYPVF